MSRRRDIAAAAPESPGGPVPHDTAARSPVAAPGPPGAPAGSGRPATVIPLRPWPVRPWPQPRPASREPETPAGPAGPLSWIARDVAAVLDPLAERTRGLPLPVVRREVQRAWRSAFGGRLGEPGLTDCAEALRDGRHWSRGLWTDGWS